MDETLFKKINLDNTEQPNEAVSEEAQQSEVGSIHLPQIQPKIKENWLKGKGKKRKLLFAAAAVVLVLLIFTAVVGFLVFDVYKKALVVKASGDVLIAAGKEQDLVKIKNELNVTKSSLNDMQGSYSKIRWISALPFVGSYINDGQHTINAGNRGIEAAELVVTIIEPYADIIGFNGETNEQAENGQITAQERLDFIVKTIPDVIPQADLLVGKIKELQVEVDSIDPNRYPEEFRGKKLRSTISNAIEQVDLAAEIVANGKPLLESAPYLLGLDKERTYLILFQNDKELRPTGGFLTAYTIAKVEKGKFEPVSSDDIYNLDAKYKPTITAPDPIVDYLKGPYVISRKLRLRDLNWSPDFYEAMKLFREESGKVGINDIDGIIAVDTQVLVNLLEVLGPIGVSGYGNFSTLTEPKCNCPQVIYELESFADIEGPVVWSENTGEIVFAPPNMDNRKKIIGPLMNSILSNTLGQSKEKIPALFEAGYKSLMEKHVIFYLFDDEHQKAVESFGIAGRVQDFDGDYLLINDANLGGRKSNLYVTQEVSQEIAVAEDGTVEKTITITYKNPEKHDGWLNSVLPNWVRIYVPKGSELVSLEGVEDKVAPYDELGKTVFAGYFQLRPQGVAKVMVKYKLPFKATDSYNLLIQKQPGKDAPLYQIKLGKKNEELFLRTDKILKFDL